MTLFQYFFHLSPREGPRFQIVLLMFPVAHPVPITRINTPPLPLRTKLLLLLLLFVIYRTCSSYIQNPNHPTFNTTPPSYQSQSKVFIHLWTNTKLNRYPEVEPWFRQGPLSYPVLYPPVGDVSPSVPRTSTSKSVLPGPSCT